LQRSLALSHCLLGQVNWEPETEAAIRADGTAKRIEIGRGRKSRRYHFRARSGTLGMTLIESSETSGSWRWMALNSSWGRMGFET